MVRFVGIRKKGRKCFGFGLMCRVEEGKSGFGLGINGKGKGKGKGKGMVHTLKWIFLGVSLHGVVATCERS